MRKAIEEAQKKIQERQIEIKYCYRKANVIADVIAKEAATMDGEKLYLREDELPENTRAPMRMDKLHLASFRYKQRKHSSGIMNLLGISIREGSLINKNHFVPHSVTFILPVVC